LAERMIDYNRPTIIRLIGHLNMEIYMYKDDPGVYLNAYGHPVPIELAQEAGYDVTRLATERRRKEALGMAAQAIDEEFASAKSGQRTVVAEHGGFKVVLLSKGRHTVEDSDGQCLTPGSTLTRDIAEGVAKSMARQWEEVNAKISVPVPQPAAGEVVGRGGAAKRGAAKPSPE